MYWDYFKNGGELPEITQNADDLGGYTEKELYVEKEFADYKEEILSHIEMEIYRTFIEEKVKTLMTSNKVKETYANRKGWDKVIKKGDPMSINHITSLVLYTDLSKYCSRFS